MNGLCRTDSAAMEEVANEYCRYRETYGNFTSPVAALAVMDDTLDGIRRVAHKDSPDIFILRSYSIHLSAMAFMMACQLSEHDESDVHMVMEEDHELTFDSLSPLQRSIDFGNAKHVFIVAVAASTMITLLSLGVLVFYMLVSGG